MQEKLEKKIKIQKKLKIQKKMYANNCQEYAIFNNGLTFLPFGNKKGTRVGLSGWLYYDLALYNFRGHPG